MARDFGTVFSQQGESQRTFDAVLTVFIDFSAIQGLENRLLFDEPVFLIKSSQYTGGDFMFLYRFVRQSPQYTGGDFMFLYRFVRRRRRFLFTR